MSAAADPFDLNRFVRAQAPVFDAVLAELGRARKTSHWMWFVFPQIEGLGFSATAQRYAIRSLEEAGAYLAHPVLGPRLDRCTDLLNAAPPERTARDILGSPDDLKLRSSLTLFLQADPSRPAQRQALQRFFGGEPDPRTLQRLGA